MNKLNPQPEPPAPGSGLLAWLTFIINYVLWLFTIPFQIAG